MNDVTQHNRNELDREIMSYVRQAAQLAPVTAEAVNSFLTVTRRRRTTEAEVADRLQYLESAGYLKKHVEWQGGEFTHYTITADGIDVLDGVKPPRGWVGK